MTDDYPLDDEDRQLIALALAILSLRRPGLFLVCHEAAAAIDAGEIFEQMRGYNAGIEPIGSALTLPRKTRKPS